ALNRSSSSCANCFSKPSSRLSNVVAMSPSRNFQDFIRTFALCISPTQRQGNSRVRPRAKCRVENGKSSRLCRGDHWASFASEQDTSRATLRPVPPPRISQVQVSREEPRQSDGLSQTTVYPDERSSPHL